MRPQTLRPASVLAKDKPHGTRIKYLGGCKCLPCRAANSSYETSRAEMRRRGLDNGLVPAARARKHLIKLSDKFVGRRAVAKTTGISQSVLSQIKHGHRKQIRKDTERKILSVTKKDAIGLVDAAPTWKLLKRLFEEGFTKRTLARRLGYKRPLQFNFEKKTITSRNAKRIKKFYEKIMVI